MYNETFKKNPLSQLLYLLAPRTFSFFLKIPQFPQNSLRNPLPSLFSLKPEIYYQIQLPSLLSLTPFQSLICMVYSTEFVIVSGRWRDLAGTTKIFLTSWVEKEESVNVSPFSLSLQKREAWQKAALGVGGKTGLCFTTSGAFSTPQ